MTGPAQNERERLPMTRQTHRIGLGDIVLHNRILVDIVDDATFSRTDDEISELAAVRFVSAIEQEREVDMTNMWPMRTAAGAMVVGVVEDSNDASLAIVWYGGGGGRWLGGTHSESRIPMSTVSPRAPSHPNPDSATDVHCINLGSFVHSMQCCQGKRKRRDLQLKKTRYLGQAGRVSM